MDELALRQRGDRAVFGVVFVMLFVFSYSEQVVSGVFPAIGGGQTAWRVAVIAVDAAVLGAVGLMKRVVTRADGDVSRLWGWWWTGVVVLLGVDVLRLFPVHSIQVDVVIATLYAVAMGWTTAASLNSDPLTLFNTSRRMALPTDWRRVRAIVPLVLGTYLCYLAASAYVDYFNVDTTRTLDAATAELVAEMDVSQQMAVLSQLCELSLIHI